MEGSNGIQSISLDGQYMIFHHLSSNVSVDLFLMDLNSGQYRRLTPEGEDFIYDYATIMPDNETAYMISNKNDRGILKVAVMNLETGELKFPNAESPWTVDDIVFSETG